MILSKVHIVMQASVITIGEAKGITLSQELITKYHITDTVELILQDDCIVVKPIIAPRQDWEQAFQAMHTLGDDRLLIDSVIDDKDWE